MSNIGATTGEVIESLREEVQSLRAQLAEAIRVRDDADSQCDEAHILLSRATSRFTTAERELAALRERALREEIDILTNAADAVESVANEMSIAVRLHDQILALKYAFEAAHERIHPAAATAEREKQPHSIHDMCRMRDARDLPCSKLFGHHGDCSNGFTYAAPAEEGKTDQDWCGKLIPWRERICRLRAGHKGDCVENLQAAQEGEQDG